MHYKIRTFSALEKLPRKKHFVLTLRENKIAFDIKNLPIVYSSKITVLLFTMPEELNVGNKTESSLASILEGTTMQ